MIEERSDASMSERPDDLPDFTNPPLIEVLIDTQFEAFPGFQQIFASEVWDIFRDEFPQVEEQQALPPSFETFGPPSRPQFNIQITRETVPTRFWFLSKNGNHLIQFQSDRFIRNWRKQNDKDEEYPRFEAIIDSFSDEFSKLSKYALNRYSHNLRINQCEVRYVNNIPIDRKTDGNLVKKFFRFGDFGDFSIDDFFVKFRRTIRGDSEEPVCRVGCECGIAQTSSGETSIKLEIYARGAPSGTSLQDARLFCFSARNEIVRLFAEITTEYAHQIWGRKK